MVNKSATGIVKALNESRLHKSRIEENCSVPAVSRISSIQVCSSSFTLLERMRVLENACATSSTAQSMNSSYKIFFFKSLLRVPYRELTFGPTLTNFDPSSNCSMICEEPLEWEVDCFCIMWMREYLYCAKRSVPEPHSGKQLHQSVESIQHSRLLCLIVYSYILITTSLWPIAGESSRCPI